MQSSYSILRESETLTARIYLLDCGVVRQVYKKDAVVEGEHIYENVRAFRKITNDLRLPFLFTPEENVTITKEAREFGSADETKSPVKAVAIMAPNMAYRLLADFYMRFHKPRLPYKVFTKNEDDAIAWLLQFVPEEFNAEHFREKTGV